MRREPRCRRENSAKAGRNEGSGVPGTNKNLVTCKGRPPGFRQFILGRVKKQGTVSKLYMGKNNKNTARPNNV